MDTRHHQLALFSVLLIISLSSCNTCEVSFDQKTADCSNRGYHHIPVLSNFTENLDLSGNDISHLDEASFLNLKNLKFLNLNWNKIKSIAKDTFSGLSSLHNLSIGHNRINILQKEFGEMRFTRNSMLEYVDISFNTKLPLYEESVYPDAVFASLSSVRELHVDLLPNPIFGTGFSNMTNLNKLVFKDCVLMHLSNDTFKHFRNLESLTYLDMSNCQVNVRHFVKMEKAFLQYFSSLQYLDLSDSYITLPVAMDILYGLTVNTNNTNPVRKMKVLNLYNVNPFLLLWMYDVDYAVKVTTEMTRYYRQLCVEDINVGNNGIVEIEVGTLLLFDDFSCLRRLTISENNFMFTFPRFALSVLQFFAKSINLEELDFSYVAIKFSMNQNTGRNSLQTKKKQSSFRCVMPFKVGRHMRYVRLTHLLFPFGLDCDIDLSTCPVLRLLDISETTILSENFRIKEVRVEYMNVSGMDFGTTGRMLLGNLKWVHRLVIQNANLDRAFSNKNYVFKDIKHVDEVDMSLNHLSTLDEESVQGLEGVNNIILSWNFFSDFPEGLYRLKNLTDIDLRHNQLTYLREKARTWLDRMNSRPERNIRISVIGNPFACTCDTLDFVFWICDTNVMLDYHNNYTCTLPNGSTVMLCHVNQNYPLYLGNCNKESFWIVFAISGISILLLLLVASSFVFKFRWKIQYFFWRKLNSKPAVVTDIRHYTYKSFITYSEEDCWSHNSFLPKLEQLEKEDGIRCCVQERDIIAGENEIKRLTEFLPDSEKFMLVLTKDFIDTKWCEFVLDICLRERMERRNNGCLVMIFKDIDPRCAPEFITNAYKHCTSITYPEEENDEEGFWYEIRQTLLH
ncbi:toll-like receptor 2 [Pecten maximus]|uniref:toll-like receptor 2 n=1 Tax=Pecten maximus TaxID=6579 RepID=UPI0014580CC4|nr:toll-like receptor 2 [Pecten maximus]